MFLKSLYLSGFKSFAHPTTINFNKEVSAIVGPNGSGKSNISDAVKFVLGEQRTKQMRSSGMKDIIFSGTRTEKARGVAEVRLVLDREPEPDLIIGRKYYKTGESEYLLNGRKVRLKDIYNEFLDTGLGRNGYSIVSQGGVENIVGASPSEIRELVEESIGIASYKVKRNETQKSLNSTQENLTRVSDVLAEMQKQLKPLEKQASKARQYLEVSKKLRVIDLVSFYDEQLKINSNLKELKDNLVDVNFTLFDLQKDNEADDKKYLSIKESLKEKRDYYNQLFLEITSNQEELTELSEEKSKLTNKIHLSVKDKDELTEKSKDYRRDIVRINKEIEEVQSIIENDKEKLNELIDQFNEHEKDYLDRSSKLNLNLIENTDKEISQLTKRIHELEIGHEKLSLNLQSLTKTIENNESLKSSIKQEINSIKEENNSLTQSFNNARKEKEDLDTHRASLINEIRNLEKELNKVSKLLNSVKSKYEYQLKVKDNYLNFNNSVRSVMSYAKELVGTKVFGPVANLFETKREYQTALSVAFGARSQNIVVSDDLVAQRLIELLKKNNKGRATFLPLNSLKVNENKSYPPINSEGFIDYAKNLITYDPKFNKVFELILGNILVFNNFKSAREFQKNNKRFSLVTLEGESFFSNGSIVGGSVKKNSMIFDNFELSNLKEELQKYSKKNIELSKSLEQKRNQLKELDREENDLIIKLQEYKNKYELNNSQLKKLNSELSKISLDLTEQQESLKQRLNTIEESLSNKREKLNELNIQKEESSKELNTLNIELNAKKDNLTNLKIEQKQLSHLLDFNSERLTKLLKEKEELEQKLKTANYKLANFGETANLYKSELQIKEEEIENLTTKISERKEETENISKSIKSLENEEQIVENSIKVRSKEINSEISAKNKLERKIERIEINERNLQNKIESTYNLNFVLVENEINSLKVEYEDYKDLDKKALEKEIRSLGNINPNAPSDYTYLKNRYTELNKQYEDLKKAKEDILSTINSLNKITSDKFSTEFIKLNKYFSEAFKILFNGGEAYLAYTDPKDVLNSGIQLFAQPPGKNLKNINLLSGGEKAMTAIALLFAFIKLNPSPFIIIDEIDAALDESNIVRFVNYIDSIKQDNQFIIISHRKSTLSFCNNIHGVSMAADGVSRLCSIDVEDYK